MPTSKTLICTHPDCNYTARSPLQQLGWGRGVREKAAEPRKCIHGHGELVAATQKRERRIL